MLFVCQLLHDCFDFSLLESKNYYDFEMCQFDLFNQRNSLFRINQSQGDPSWSSSLNYFHHFFIFSVYFQPFNSILQILFMQTQQLNPQLSLQKGVFDQFDGKCVCDLCNCNARHQCPLPGYPLETQTTHRTFYTPHKIQPLRREKAVYQPLSSHYEPDDLKSQYRTLYTPKDIDHSPRRTKNIKREYCPSPFKLEGQTEYNKKYSPHKLPQQQMRPRTAKAEYCPSPFKFEGDSQYKGRYSPHKIDPKDSKTKHTKNKKRQYLPSPFKLQDQTEYKTKYSPKKMTTQQGSTPLSPKKKREYVPSPFKFQGDTTYATAYIPKRTEESPSPRKKSEYSPSKHRLQTETTYVGSFKRFQPSIYSPSKDQNRSPKKSTYEPSPHKFEGQSRYRQFYKPHQVKPRQRCPTSYLPHRPLRCSPGKNHVHYTSSINRWE